MKSLDEFLENLYRFGLEFFRKYYGPYRAIVTENKDPQKRGRVQVHCPRALLTSKNDKWVLPMNDGSGKGKGIFWPPEVGDAVWIFFDNGDPQYPASYLGGWYATGDLSPDLAVKEDYTPERRGFITPGGHRIILDDTKDAETVIVEHKDGQRVQITKDKVKLGKKDGSFEPMLKGDTVKQWLATHTHITPFGSSSPPTQPFPVGGLSDDTETS